MGTVRNLAIGVLIVTFCTFVALFGRLPALRNTPIGALHRVIWLHIPVGLRSLDQWLSNGRLSVWAGGLANHLWNDKHPVVLVFFLLLLSVSEGLFLPSAWSLMSNIQRGLCAILVLLPYLFLYLSAATNPGHITRANHTRIMALYPYDFTIFHPGQICRTCHLLKPARSKHCSICKRCISKLDHHCIFINNCVGYENHHWFILLLFSTALLTSFGTYMGISLLGAQARKEIPSWTLIGKGYKLSEYLNIWAWMLQEWTGIGSVALLCLLISPLVWTLLGYHIYLVWVGTTTNESMKWSDLQAEISDGFVFKRSLPTDRRKDLTMEPAWTQWPVESEQIVLRAEDGLPPRGPGAIGVGQWLRIWKLSEVENLYDLGFLDNLADVFRPKSGFQPKDGSVKTSSRSLPASPGDSRISYQTEESS